MGSRSHKSRAGRGFPARSAPGLLAVLPLARSARSLRPLGLRLLLEVQPPADLGDQIAHGTSVRRSVTSVQATWAVGLAGMGRSYSAQPKEVEGVVDGLWRIRTP
jgi:hypothetical protein